MKLSKKIKDAFCEVRHFEVTRADLDGEKEAMRKKGLGEGHSDERLIESLVQSQLDESKYEDCQVLFVCAWGNDEGKEGYVVIVDVTE